ncbi:MAG: hypothetical protein AAF958_00440 [Planctomycetota bacterium]
MTHRILHPIALFFLVGTAFVFAPEARGELVLSSQYLFDTDLSDSLGNQGDLSQISGGSLAGGGFTFGNDEGLSLTTNLTDDDYRIEFDVTFTDLAGWDKLIDFKDGASDDGLYLNATSNNFLTFFGAGVANGGDFVDTGTSYTVSIQRVDEEVTASVDGVEQFSFFDFGDDALTATDQIAFFVDDSVTGDEGVAGTITELRLFTNAVTIPEPSGMMVLAGLAAAAARFSRRARSRKFR